LNLAGIFEGGLVFVSLGLAWAFSIDLAPALVPRMAPAIAGLVGAIPPFVLLVATDRLRIGPLERIKKIVLETLGPSLAACRWYDLALLAALAGIGEELLFRGVAQPLFERWVAFDGLSRAAGLLGSNLIFGLLHLITPLYGILAGAMGVYFGLLLDITGSRNLLAPMIAHAVYDFLAFLVVVRAQRMASGSPTSQGPPSAESAEIRDTQVPTNPNPPS
jgi:uncharacterized protein